MFKMLFFKKKKIIVRKKMKQEFPKVQDAVIKISLENVSFVHCPLYWLCSGKFLVYSSWVIRKTGIVCIYKQLKTKCPKCSCQLKTPIKWLHELCLSWRRKCLIVFNMGLVRPSMPLVDTRGGGGVLPYSLGGGVLLGLQKFYPLPD